MSQNTAPISVADQTINLLTAAKAGKPIEHQACHNSGVWVGFVGSADNLAVAISVRGVNQFRVKPTVKREPLSAKDFPPGTVVRYRDLAKTVFATVTAVGPAGIYFSFNSNAPKFREYDHPELITGQLRRKLPGKDSKWIRAYNRVEVSQ